MAVATVNRYAGCDWVVKACVFRGSDGAILICVGLLVQEVLELSSLVGES